MVSYSSDMIFFFKCCSLQGFSVIMVVDFGYFLDKCILESSFFQITGIEKKICSHISIIIFGLLKTTTTIRKKNQHKTTTVCFLGIQVYHRFLLPENMSDTGKQGDLGFGRVELLMLISLVLL